LLLKKLIYVEKIRIPISIKRQCYPGAENLILAFWSLRCILI